MSRRSVKRTWFVIRQYVLPNFRHLHQSRVRVCGCCQRLTLVLSLSESDEAKRCVRCRAGLRHEMLAQSIRLHFPDLEKRAVLELDPDSELRGLLDTAGSHTRTYFAPGGNLGTTREDGARCEDITKLTLSDCSVDLIVSSDVLEHVPDIKAAFRETARVLCPGGMHLFTVPTSSGHTIKRAEIRDGRIHHLDTPEYHGDPENPDGILAFWTFGREDFREWAATDGLEIDIASGPKGWGDGRVVWRALKRA
jgi:SAM-dependent methyltransferase